MGIAARGNQKVYAAQWVCIAALGTSKNYGDVWAGIAARVSCIQFASPTGSAGMVALGIIGRTSVHGSQPIRHSTRPPRGGNSFLSLDASPPFPNFNG